MDNISVVLVVLMGLVLSLMLAPNVIAMNRGKSLRNMAIWLAIFLGLTILYRATHTDTTSLEQGVDQTITQSFTPTGAKALNDPYQGREGAAETGGDSSEKGEDSGNDSFVPPND